MSSYDETAKRGFLSRFLTWKLARRVAIAGAILGLLLFLAIVIWFAALNRGLPTVANLKQYEPPITSRVHAGDGSLIAEFADEHRVFVPYESIPQHVIDAFVAAEDKKFFDHGGIDYMGMTRGVMRSARNKITGSGGLQGGSTITQQVAKNMLLTSDQTITRKAKEALLAWKMEDAFSKEKIMELYLNEIYLGSASGKRSFGVGSAALNYFDKSLPELDLSEAAILASLPKAPGRVNPERNPERLLQRRNYVLRRMVEDNYITQEEADAARALPLTTKRRLNGDVFDAAAFFKEEVRKELVASYGEEGLKSGGLSIRTTIDSRLQLAAVEALQNGLEAYDRRHDYRGPVTNISTGDAWQEQLQGVSAQHRQKAQETPGTHRAVVHKGWEVAMVKRVPAEKAATLLTMDGHEVPLPVEDVEWAKTWEPAGLRPGHVIYIEVAREDVTTPEPEPVEEEEGENLIPQNIEIITKPVGAATLRQVPKVEGSLLALDPHTGRVLAMAGGYSFKKNEYNRAIQAERQPGSAFKPFAYVAALERGYTPASIIQDTPYCELDVSTDQYWCPKNYTAGRSYGQVTLRRALEKSFNQVTARVANDIRLESVSALSERLGIYDQLPPYTAMSLGAGDTTMLRLAEAYAALVNGGREVNATLIDRIQNRHGATMFRHDKRDCSMCRLESWDGSPPPELEDNREQLLDPVIAFQMTHMLEGVVQRGTGRNAKRVGKPLAGKTGTTNDYKDAWFMGFSPDLVVGVWVGFDTPEPLGDGEAGGAVAAPIFTEFMQEALKDTPALPFRIPPGVRLVEIDADTGQLPTAYSSDVIVEAFQPDSAPGFDFGDEERIGNIFSSGRDDPFGEDVFAQRPAQPSAANDPFAEDVTRVPADQVFPTGSGQQELPEEFDPLAEPEEEVVEEGTFDDGIY